MSLLSSLIRDLRSAIFVQLQAGFTRGGFEFNCFRNNLPSGESGELTPRFAISFPIPPAGDSSSVVIAGKFVITWFHLNVELTWGK